MRGEVAGSAHSSCSLISDYVLRMMTSISVSAGKISKVEVEGDESIVFNSYGIKNGWCAWPVNFDPVWVECTADMEKIKKLYEHRKSNDRSINQ
jgi:hypothetical protein